ncbi:MAG: family 43 glycosylhydrolase, partial [Oscillospiraceae bacterium]|nr:family 43 glycosylhydrolase [Oscillospiraceae bacterium]
MYKRALSLLIALVMVLSCVSWTAPQHVHAASSQRQMEALDRGLVAVKTSGGVFLSWRLLGTESYNTTFNVYRDGKLIASNISNSTNYLDAGGSSSSSYYVRSVVSGSETTQSAAVKPWAQNYLDVPLQKPANVTMDGATVTYSANDATVADVDGDGAYEIILKWDPSNSQDNSKSGYTANVYVDCYELDGTMRWRIDLGRNIRAGAHYTQIIAYDLNGDGKAEVAMKTADGTVDGQGNVIGDKDADYRNSSGYILSGPEYLTLFEGKTGKELVTIDYYPERGKVSSWGDSYGNRVDRFLAGVAYFDGKTPSLVVCRGYYTRCVIVSYEYKGGTLNREWVFDSNDSGNGDYAGEGNHNLSIADVDGDGYDEIVYGSAVIDHNGKGLYATGHGHGDALHVGDFDPDRSGLEVFQVHEETGSSIESIQFRDAGTGKTIWAKKLSKDTGRGLILNIDPEFYPYVTLASGSNYHTAGGSSVTSSISGLGINFACYWDGDLYREGLDGTTVRKWDYNNNKVVTALSGSNVHSNNSTKSTPSLSGDILGDWREEVIWPTSDDKALRIYTTTDITDAKLYTLMHDSQYRCAIAWQNVAYNQPPHTSYFIGPTMATPTQPSIYTVGSFSLAAPDGGSSGGDTPAQTTAAPVQTSTSGGSVTSGSYTHNFTASGKNSDFYTISGNTSTSKGSVSYNSLTLTTCLKMESATNISFTAPSNGTLTLVFGGSTDAGGKSVKVDGSSKTIGSDGILTLDISAGSHTVTKGDSINLFYMVYTPAGSSGETHTHSYSSSVTTAATCTSAGVRTYSCSCGSSYTEAIAALGHNYSGGSCTRCGAADPNSGSQDTGTYDRVTVHDPSIVEANGMYYIFGSHMAWAKSSDLRSWTTFTTNVNTNYANIFATNAAWAANGGTQGNSAYDVSGNLWAPDVIYNEKLGKWCMYMSVNGDNYYSSIAMATADSIEGPYTYAGTVVYSGFANSTQAAQTDFKQVTGTNTVPSRYLTNGAWNPQYGTNAIDPCVFYDKDGNLWMVYGSWFGGLFLLRLDESTGLRDYSYTYSTTTDASDQYLGIRLSGGYGCTGEGPYIVYDDATGYYYLYVTYGGLNATDSFGNYNMRLFRSKSVTGPYTDAAGNSAICTSSGADQTVKGIKLMGNYFFSSLANAPSGEGSTAGYKSPGHNSAFIDNSGNRFLIYHTRFNLGSEWHQVRVHQQFLNADGWPVTAVYEYRGNSISTGYTDAEIVGRYEFVNHGSTAGATNAGMLTTQNIVLNSNGTITGDVTGTWSRTSGSYYCTMVIDGVTYKGVFFKQQDESAAHNMVMTFSAIGSNNQSIWGSQTKAEASGWIIDSPAWWGNHSGAVQVTENIQSWTFTNTTYADAADNWDTASVVVFRSANGTVSGSNYIEELLIRSDSYAVSEEYGWDTTGEAPFGAASYPSDWAAWLSANKSGASCTVTAQLVGDRIIVGFSNNGVVNVYSVPKNTSSSSPVYLSLTGEETTMTAWKTTSNHIDISDAVAAAGGSSGGDVHTHSYSSKVTTAATCATAGVRTYTCSCGDSYTESIPATGNHSYSNGSCTVCGAKDPSYNPGGSVTSGSYIHNFTDDGFTSDFYTFAGSQITDGKHGTYTYDFGYGTETLNYALKFDSKGSVTFTAPADGKLTIAAAASSTNRKVGVFDAANNEVGTLSTPNTNTLYVLTVDVSANTAYTVKRTSNESGLYYIAFV